METDIASIASKNEEKIRKPGKPTPFRLEAIYSDRWRGTVYNILMQSGEFLRRVEYFYYYREGREGEKEGPFIGKLYKWIDNPRISPDRLGEIRNNF